jgi:endonuclease YncB( thermonuclease family)
MMRRFLFIFLLTLTIGLPPTPSFSAEKGQGKVYVVDGDTFHMNGQKIRIWGIDAVELHQTCLKSGHVYECGKSARLYLQSVIGKIVPVCTSKPKSSKETRTVASCQINGEDLGREMVKSGWALDYKHFSKGEYSAEEQDARENKLGIWSGEFQSPYVWRKSHKTY